MWQKKLNFYLNITVIFHGWFQALLLKWLIVISKPVNN